MNDTHDVMDELLNVPLDEWHKQDWSDIIDYRKSKKDNPKELFEKDIKLYQKALNGLPPFNKDEIRAEIDEWDLDIPSEEYDFKVLQEAYSRLVSYRWRLIEWIYVVNLHYDIYSTAYKKLSKSAMLLFTGTAKDKEAFAESLVHPFAMCMSKPKALLDYLIEVKDHIDFAATNMARALREREALAKINNEHNREGMYSNFMKNIEREMNEEENKTIGIPHTRKRVVLSEDEDE